MAGEAFGLETPDEEPAQVDPALEPERTQEDLTPADILTRVRENFSPENGSDVRRDVDRMDGRLDAIQSEIRGLGKTEEPAPVERPLGVDFGDPAVGKALQDLYGDDDPAAFGRGVGALVKAAVDEASQAMTARFDTLNAETTKAREDTESNANFARNIEQALPVIRQMGELEEAIVVEYERSGAASFLGQYLAKFPSLAQDAQGVLGAGLAVARLVGAADARHNSTDAGDGEPAADNNRSVHSEAAPSRGSNRSVRRIADDSKGKEGDLTPAEALRKSVVEASSSGANLPGVFHSG